MTTAAEKRNDATVARALAILTDRMATKGPDLADFDDLAEYMRLHLSDKEREIFWVIALDEAGCLLAAEPLHFGTFDKCEASAREILKFLLRYNARRAIFAHNHPHGQAEPSTMDFDQTQSLHVLLGLVGIELVEHLIVAGMNVVRVSEFERRPAGKAETPPPSESERLNIISRTLAGALRMMTVTDPRETEPDTLLVAAAWRVATATR